MNKNSGHPKQARLPATSRSLPIALIRAREKVMEPVRAMLADAGVTEQQWRVLRVLDELGSIEASGLAERSCLLPSSQSRIVQTLVSKKLVQRSTDAGDRRKQLISITPAGNALINDNIEEAKQIADDIEKALGKAKLRSLLDLLNELIRLD